MNDLQVELLQRLNGRNYEKHDIKMMFVVNYYEMLDDGTVKLIVKPCDNPDYDPQYWQKQEAARLEGAKNDSNK